MTPLNLPDLKRKAEAATPGPWDVDSSKHPKLIYSNAKTVLTRAWTNRYWWARRKVTAVFTNKKH